MANKMLIDAAHPEETRVVVVRGQRVEEFDFESAQRKPLRGNIYLAKVMRVEPSLQAAFVDYGGNRHGFLAFSEIHPDYYQIPVADREALLAEEARSARESDDDEPGPRRNKGRRNASPAKQRGNRGASISSEEAVEEKQAASAEPIGDASPEGESQPQDTGLEASEAHLSGEDGPASAEAAARDEEAQPISTADDLPAPGADAQEPGEEAAAAKEAAEPAEQVIEQLGAGDGLEEVPERRRPPRRNYKIQEVIKRRQILLVQVVKEERGNKGAALTTYLSLAGRYSVLMPNTARGGGISRKITNAPDRKRLKSVAQELDVPDGMGVIVRTAGAARTKAEIKRDFEYLLRLWENVRELTLKSSAPTLVHEEGSLIKRAIRDLYNKDIDEILVAGEEGYKEAKDFMRMLAPSHAKVVKLDKETEPVFSRFGVERQLDAMFSNVVTLRSGGYLVMNQTEALVAIDVNSGRATREHNIEDTALKTNLEAAEETARQLRLRDLAGLIVIDFIDMDEKRNNRSVEKRLKDCLKNDRARIQVGSISPFGLLEMSRQRIRSGVVEGSSTPCPHCAGAGRVRSTPSVALHVLRHVEDALVKNASRSLICKTRTDVALYILNQKRGHLRQIEDRFGVPVSFVADDKLNGVEVFAIEYGEPIAAQAEAAGFEPEARRAEPAPRVAEKIPVQTLDEDLPDEAADAEDDAPESAEARRGGEGEGSQRRKRRRRRRRGGERDAQPGQGGQPYVQDGPGGHIEASPVHDAEGDEDLGAPEADGDERADGSPSSDNEPPRKRRRGRRGGGRARREDGEDLVAFKAHETPRSSESEAAEHPGRGNGPVGDDTIGEGASAEMATGGTRPRSDAAAELRADEHDVPPVEEPVASAAIVQPSESAIAEASRDANTIDITPPTPEQAQLEPVLTSTYDPARAKRAGWWSKARSAFGAKE